MTTIKRRLKRLKLPEIQRAKKDVTVNDLTGDGRKLALVKWGNGPNDLKGEWNTPQMASKARRIVSEAIEKGQVRHRYYEIVIAKVEG